MTQFKKFSVMPDAAGRDFTRILDGDGQEVAEVRGASFTEALANARLLAAAPDLLDACRRALKEIRDDDITIGLEEDLESAIKRATTLAIGDE